jgi:hypothetical protein
MTIKDAAKFAVMIPRTPGHDPEGSEAFDNICMMIRLAIETEIEERVRRGELVRP